MINFQGKSKSFTTRAILNRFFRCRPLPFDRHDWIISRNVNNVEVRDVYIIDYYSHGDEKIYYDVRLQNTFKNFIPNMRMLFYNRKKKTV